MLREIYHHGQIHVPHGGYTPMIVRWRFAYSHYTWYMIVVLSALNTTVIKFEPEVSLQSCLDCFLELKRVGEIYVFSSQYWRLQT